MEIKMNIMELTNLTTIYVILQQCEGGHSAEVLLLLIILSLQ